MPLNSRQHCKHVRIAIILQVHPISELKCCNLDILKQEFMLPSWFDLISMSTRLAYQGKEYEGRTMQGAELH